MVETIQILACRIFDRRKKQTHTHTHNKEKNTQTQLSRSIHDGKQMLLVGLKQSQVMRVSVEMCHLLYSNYCFQIHFKFVSLMAIFSDKLFLGLSASYSHILLDCYFAVAMPPTCKEKPRGWGGGKMTFATEVFGSYCPCVSNVLSAIQYFLQHLKTALCLLTTSLPLSFSPGWH